MEDKTIRIPRQTNTTQRVDQWHQRFEAQRQAHRPLRVVPSQITEKLDLSSLDDDKTAILQKIEDNVEIDFDIEEMLQKSHREDTTIHSLLWGIIVLEAIIMIVLVFILIAVVME